MAKDPAFLFYPGDWLGGTMLMTRHQKGCYIDLLMAQFNGGPLTLDQIKLVLGQDQAVWTVLQDKFKQDNSGRFFNEKLATEVEKRKNFVATRSNGKQGRKSNDKSHENHLNIHTENGDGSRDETINEDWIKWGEQILRQEDVGWQQMRGRKMDKGEMDIFLSVAVRRDWKMESQQAFRISLQGFKINGYANEKVIQTKWKV